MVVLDPTTVSIVEAQEPARVEAQEPEPAGAVVTAFCREGGCEAPGFIACAYVDGRGRSCGTRWCAHHAHKIGAQSYCRRHASTVAALGGRANDPRALPFVDYRGASLVNWVCTEGHAALRGAVAAGLRPGEVIFDDRTVNVVRRATGDRRWEQGWRIGDRSGLTGRVMICVDEFGRRPDLGRGRDQRGGGRRATLDHPAAGQAGGGAAPRRLRPRPVLRLPDPPDPSRDGRPPLSWDRAGGDR